MDLEALKETPPWEWPEDADELLLGVLDNSHYAESDRLLATQLAGDCVVISDDLVSALLAILRNDAEPEALRGQAAISLGPVLELSDIDGFDDPDDTPISESTFYEIQGSLQRLYRDANVPKFVRRRVLEASVRAAEDWHTDAVRASYGSNDDDWRLTAVFCMRWIRGFDKQILDSLGDDNEEIHCEAVYAAGEWQLDDAWPHVVDLITAEKTEKNLLLAAMDAAVNIRPQEAGMYIVALTDADDDDIAEAADEAIAVAEVNAQYEDLDDDYPF